MRYRIL